MGLEEAGASVTTGQEEDASVVNGSDLCAMYGRWARCISMGPIADFLWAIYGLLIESVGAFGWANIYTTVGLVALHEPRTMVLRRAGGTRALTSARHKIHTAVGGIKDKDTKLSTRKVGALRCAVKVVLYILIYMKSK